MPYGSAAPGARNSPTECPTTYDGTMPRARSAASIARLVATSAGAAHSVSTSSPRSPRSRGAGGRARTPRCRLVPPSRRARPRRSRSPSARTALTGKHEGQLARHAIAPFVDVHSTSAGHVRPRPYVIGTSRPRPGRPSSAASASDRIDPDSVAVPIHVHDHLSGRNPDFLVAWSMIRTFAWCGT